MNSHRPEIASSDAWSKSGVILLAALAVYFGLHVATRSLISPNMQLDEAEQLVLTQDWSWGYGSQPPLYNWLQKVLFSVFGLQVFALSVLKNTVLWSLYAFVYLAAREIFSQRRPAVLATVSVLLLPHIAWESQRDQTHLILATACSAATLYLFVRLMKRGKTGDFAFFGAALALGLLSKYNYLFFALSLLLGAATIPRLRSRLGTPKMLIALLVFAAITAPHFYWLIHHPSFAASQSYKFKMATSGHGFGTCLHGVLRLAGAALAFLVAPLLIYSPLLCRVLRTRSFRVVAEEEQVWLKLLLRVFICGLVLALLMVLLFRVTFIQSRWLEPLLFALPILLVGWTQPEIQSRPAKPLLWLAGAVAVTVLLVINGTVLGANLLHRAHNLNVPHAAIAAGLREAGFHDGTIIASDLFLGGNLKNQFPDSRVVVARVSPDSTVPGGDRLIVWRVRNKDEPDSDFLAFAEKLCGISTQQMTPQYLAVPSKNGPRLQERIGFVLVKDH